MGIPARRRSMRTVAFRRRSLPPASAPSEASEFRPTSSAPISTPPAGPSQPATALPKRLAIAKLIHSAIASLDGYVADEEGNFDWAAPDEEVHRFVNDLERPVGTYLYGRRMYEVMSYWGTAPAVADQPAFVRDFAQIWRAADKIVYSKTLQTLSSARTRIERHFDPEAVRSLKATASRDITVGGPELAAQAIEAGLVDEFQLFLTPVVVGAGKSFLPDDVRLTLELLEERRFGSGVVYLRYS